MINEERNATRCEVTASLLRNVRPRAAIDWIEVEVSLARSTNFSAVQHVVMAGMRTERRPWVFAMDKGPGSAATRFRIRIQDPPQLIKMRTAFKELEKSFGFLATPSLQAIEVAIDFYSRSPDSDVTKQMAMLLMQGIYAGGKDRRQARRRGETVLLTFGERLDLGKTLYVANRWDPITVQVYFKTTDNNRQPILPADYRARAEVTLTGPGLIGNASLVGTFERLELGGIKRLLSFRMVERGSMDLQTPLQEVIAAHHRREMDGRGVYARAPCPGSRRKFSPLHRPNTLLNQKVRDSMKGLTDRMHRKTRVIIGVSV